MPIAKQKPTLSDNPLDAVIPRRPAARSTNAVPQSVAGAEEKKQIRERATFHLPVDVLDRAKNAVYWTPGLTMGDLAATALRDAVDGLEKKRGSAFPVRNGELKGGRPLK